MRRLGTLAPVLTACSLYAGSAPAQQAPDRTLTVYVHGFERTGADHSGEYGINEADPVVDAIAAVAGLPTVSQLGGPTRPNAVAAVRYYGDRPPAYYSPARSAQVDSITTAWGGGVPRYALIVANYARHALAASGAEQVNFVSASFGSLVVRWLIEKNVAGLAAEGRIARWLTIEGVLCGSWPASQGDLVALLDQVDPLPIDVDHMTYDWLEANLHAPRGTADSDAYAGILIGQIGSTNDELNEGALTGLMTARGQYQPNDGIQALGDVHFADVTARSRLFGLQPTFATLHVNHYAVADHHGAWAQAATFVTQRRRVTVTMTSATIDDLHEPQLPFWNWTPAEVVFESEIRSPRVGSRWGFDAPLSELRKSSGAAPLRRYRDDGETQQFTHVVFDQLVLQDETELSLDLHAVELDFDPHYEVWETVQPPYDDDLGAGSIQVSTLQPATYAFQAGAWRCTLAVAVFEYPFALPTDAAGLSPVAPQVLRSVPEPFSSSVWIYAAPASASTAAGHAARSAGRAAATTDPDAATTATLWIYDVSGRLLRRVAGDASPGFVWNGTDDGNRPLPSGVYVYRLDTAAGTLHGKGHLLR